MKLVNEILKMVEVQGEAGTSSYDMTFDQESENGDMFGRMHWHKIEINAQGNGKTIYTGPYPSTDEDPKSDWRKDLEHSHAIENGMILPAADGHSHKIEA
jgi:hypothetical protein